MATTAGTQDFRPKSIGIHFSIDSTSNLRVKAWPPAMTLKLRITLIERQITAATSKGASIF